MRAWLGIAAINGGLAVLLGAFAAHGLKARLTPDMLGVFETGARYHMYHALAMGMALELSRLLAAWLSWRVGLRWLFPPFRKRPDSITSAGVKALSRPARLAITDREKCHEEIREI